MAPNLNLVPDLKSKVLLILAVLAVATVGLFERRDKITLHDGAVITGKVLEQNEGSLTLVRGSGYKQTIDLADIASRSWLHFEVDLQLGLDLRGGTALRYRLDLDKFPADQRADIHDRTVQTFQSRLDNLGVKEMSVVKSGTEEIIVELPGVTKEESDSYEKVIESLGSLRFAIQPASRSGVIDAQAEETKLRDHLKQLTDAKTNWTRKSVDLSQFDVAGRDGVTYRWFPWQAKAITENPGLAEFPFLLVELNPKQTFTGEDIERTFTDIDQRGFPAMGFEMKGTRASDFGEFTESHIGRPMAILLNDEVASAPVLEAAISNRGIITGGTNGFTKDELANLNTVLASGSLRVSPTQMSKETIGPTLGVASIHRGIVAGVLCFVLVIGFMVLYYMSTGVIAAITLIVGIYTLIGGLGFLEATLTLPGIAGILLTVGMAVDQNILINERIREEREKGKTLAQSVKNGFERAFVTIVDSQATTFIAGFVLYKMGSGPIRGFAVTLMLGIATTMFAALVGSKVIFAIGLERDWFKSMRMRSFIGSTDIQFTRYFRQCLTASGICIVGGMLLFAYDYRDMQGIDFAGGFQAHVRFKEPIAGQEVRSELGAIYPGAQIVAMIGAEGSKSGPGGATTDFQIKIRTTGGDAAEGDQRIEYLTNIRGALGDRMLPDAIEIAPDGVSAQADGRVLARFTLHFTAPMAQDALESRLRERLTIDSVAPVSGSSPAADYQVTARLALPSADRDAVKAQVAPTLSSLPEGVLLLDPVPESQFIGGRVGKELRNSAIKAIVLAILAILIYIRVRFNDVNYGLAACVALTHDVLVSLGIATLVHRLGIVNIELDLSMIGAFLTVIGYSLNDTIVIFDRVRENLPRVNKPLDEVINLSINQTLSRTLLTVLTTLFTLFVLFALNYGQRNTVEGFAFVMIVGIFAGTYSTIYIASPMLVWLTKRTEAQKLSEQQTATA